MKNVYLKKMEKKLVVGGIQIVAVNTPDKDKFVIWLLQDVVKHMIAKNQERFQILPKFLFLKLKKNKLVLKNIKYYEKFQQKINLYIKSWNNEHDKKLKFKKE